MSLSDEGYAGRLLAMDERELVVELRRLYSSIYCPSTLHPCKRKSRSLAVRRLQTAYHVCQTRSRMEIYREAGNKAQAKREPREPPEQSPGSRTEDPLASSEAPFTPVTSTPLEINL